MSAKVSPEALSIFRQIAVRQFALIPEDQREQVANILVDAAQAVFPKAMEKLKVSAETFTSPEKLEEGEWTLVPLDSIHFNLDTWRYNYTSTGEQSHPIEGLVISDKLYLFAIGFKNPEPSPKVSYIRLKLNIRDYGYIMLEDLMYRDDPNRVKPLDFILEFPPESKITTAKVGVLSTGYDNLQLVGGAFVRVQYVTERSKATFYPT